MPPPMMYTPEEARKLLRIGRSRFYELLRQGPIKSIRNGRRYLIPELCLNEYIIALTLTNQEESANND